MEGALYVVSEHTGVNNRYLRTGIIFNKDICIFVDTEAGHAGHSLFFVDFGSSLAHGSL